MSKYAVYEIFGDSAPFNVEFCGHLVGARVGTSDKNPLDISDTTHHTSEPVRCKDCALYDREDGLCYRDPNHSGYYRPAHDDGFCAWGERREVD